MFDITLITMGKLKEKFYLSAAEEYCKRLKGYCNFHLVELPEHRLPEDPSPAEIAAGLDKEAELIFQKIPKGAWLCIFTPEGKTLSSEQFAAKLKEIGSLTFRKNGEIVSTMQEEPLDLALLPFPYKDDFSDIENQIYLFQSKQFRKLRHLVRSTS